MFVTVSLYPAGAERHAVTLMNGLAQRGHDCHAVHIKEESPNLSDKVRLGNGGTLRCLNARRYLDAGALRDFARHIARVEPSVIVATNPYALMYSRLALWLARASVPLVVTYHSTLLLGLKERVQMIFYRPFFWSADCSVFVCEVQRRRWLRRGVFSRRTEVIYNGVNTEEFHDRSTADERARLRRSLGFSDDDFIIGMSARLRPEKNHVQLVDAIAALRKTGVPARALMIGDGEMRETVEARARDLGVSRDVVITGFQDDVRLFLAICNTLLLCSLTETFSLAAIEAMAMGKPVVHSDVGGGAEMIVPGRNGFLFPVGDTEALVCNLAILAQPEVSLRMGRNARRDVEARFSEQPMMDRYERLLSDLCRERLRPRKAKLGAGRAMRKS